MALENVDYSTLYGDSGKEWADSREERGDSGQGILERNGKGLRIVGKRGGYSDKERGRVSNQLL